MLQFVDGRHVSPWTQPSTSTLNTSASTAACEPTEPTGPVLNVLFRNSYTKTYVDEVTREDILKFTSDCFDQGLVPRTVYDRLVTVLQLFKRHGFKGLVEASDWPSYVETIRPIYEPEEIAAMLRHANLDEAILIKFCLSSGFRDREIRYVTWRDVDLRNSVVRVTAKPLWKIQTKELRGKSCAPACGHD